MTDLRPNPLVSPAWLAPRLQKPDIRVIDATWFLPNDGGRGRAAYNEKRIPGAVFFDIDAISDASSTLPHMLPSPPQFAAQAGALGLGDGQELVVYDAQGMFSAARVWWMFRAMGHDDIFVLDGGLPAWEAGGYPLENGQTAAARGETFTSRLRPELVRSLPDMLAAAAARDTSILDARPAGRFAGRDAEPRPGVRAGHIPGARSLPFGELLSADKTFKSKQELEDIFARHSIEPGRGIIAACGSGVTAAIIALALARIGRWDVPIYDGSWAEWGSRADTPIETGGA